MSALGRLAPAVIAVLLVAGCVPDAADLRDFSSDGCSLFPDGLPGERSKWCDCCLAHDIAYWAGGTQEERQEADARLRSCVLERTGDRTLAETVYLGVRAGGHPAFPTWYRWAYGWPYGRGYQPLTDGERVLIQDRIGAYGKRHPGGYCREQHPQTAPAATNRP